MTRSTWLWFLAVILTIGTLVYQRMTGPTYPLRGGVTFGGHEIRIKLVRSHGGTGDQPVRVVTADTAVRAMVLWRRHPTNETWTTVDLTRQGDTLSAVLPHQPPAGKLAYQLRLMRGLDEVLFPVEPAITRFKGDISAFIIIPHLICMFGGLMLLMRAGIGALAKESKYPRWATVGVVLFGLGGFVFGPWMQHQAFGPWWAGFPFGGDMTDNKTAVAMLAWLFALWRMRGGKQARGPVIAAALVTLAIFLIPHSVFGSQIDWSKAAPPTAP
jgi:hypothetical protein